MARLAGPRRLLTPRLIQQVAVVLILLLLAMVAIGLAVSFVRMTWQEHQINRGIERQEAQNAYLADRNAELKAAAEFAESDVAAERAARERLGMAREGEMVLLPTVVLPPAPTDAPPPTVEEAVAPVEERISNAAGWWQAFFPGPDVLP